MTGFWIFGLIFSTMYTLHPDRHWVTAQSLIQPPVYQPDKELSVDMGGSATLRCCISEKVEIIAWIKQPNGKKPRTIVTVHTTSGQEFYSGSTKSFKIERSSNCINLIILNIMHSDLAMYYCALTKPNLVFADGTYLKLKGEHVTIASETSKPTPLHNSVVYELTLPGNNTNINTQEITVLWLGAALGLCVLLIFGLAYFILRRRKFDKINASIENSPEMRQLKLQQSIMQL
ncbi:uncharacterized protein Hap1MRO34_012112 isoform 2-T2 [Clarias gariepinus]|uniref:uncharacterized protein LOC128532301 isoform X2 n=1 Tax=Clarias gariepinus TaxID=13013 RepID=UPI00234D3DF3|nr:uncharacterized protein LOC128532301 isoform X2 [Clarias gariepinus]